MGGRQDPQAWDRSFASWVCKEGSMWAVLDLEAVLLPPVSTNRAWGVPHPKSQTCFPDAHTTSLQGPMRVEDVKGQRPGARAFGHRQVPPRPTFSTSRPPFLTEPLRRGPDSVLVVVAVALRPARFSSCRSASRSLASALRLSVW